MCVRVLLVVGDLPLVFHPVIEQLDVVVQHRDGVIQSLIDVLDAVVCDLPLLNGVLLCVAASAAVTALEKEYHNECTHNPPYISA